MEAKNILQESDKREKPNLDLQNDFRPVPTSITKPKYSEMCERLKNITAFRVDVNHIDPKTGAPIILQQGDKVAEKPKSASRNKSQNDIKLLPFRVPSHMMVETETELPINNRRTASANRSKDKGKVTSKRISQRSSFMHPAHKRAIERCVKTSLFKSPVPASKNYGIKPKSRCTKLETNPVDETLPLIDMDDAEDMLLKSNLVCLHKKSLYHYVESPATREFCEMERQILCSAKKTNILKNTNDINALEKYEQDFKDFRSSHSKNMDLLQALKETNINEILANEKKNFDKIMQSHTKFMETIREQTNNMFRNGKENEAMGTPKSHRMKNSFPHLSNAMNNQLIEQQQYRLLQDTPIRK